MNPRNKLREEEVDRRLVEKGIRRVGSYVGALTPMSVICMVCGWKWNPVPSDLFRAGGHVCPDCNNRKRRLTTNEVDRRLFDKHLRRMGPYINTDTPMSVACMNCNWKRKVRLYSVDAGRTCPKCSNRKKSELFRSPIEEVDSKLLERNVRRLGHYVKTRSTVLLLCLICDKKWSGRLDMILDGQGCPHCAVSGFQPDKPAIVYYVRVTNPFGDPVYKIGITNYTVSERFGPDFRKMAIIETWSFQIGAEAYGREQEILKDHDADRYEGPDILTRGGNDELFSCDVLQLDKGYGQLELAAK